MMIRSPIICRSLKPRILISSRSSLLLRTNELRSTIDLTRSYSSNPDKPTVGQRISNAASFSFYSAIVLAGLGMSGLVVYYVVSDLLLPTSDVQVFNRAFSIVEKDLYCQRLLGNKISAYGESVSGNKWARNRPIASRRGVDRNGKEHLLMQFHVEGELSSGLVRLEMIKHDQSNDQHKIPAIGSFDFRYLVVEIPGYQRYYLIDNTAKPTTTKPSTGFLGVKWGKS